MLSEHPDLRAVVSVPIAASQHCMFPSDGATLEAALRATSGIRSRRDQNCKAAPRRQLTPTLSAFIS